MFENTDKSAEKNIRKAGESPRSVMILAAGRGERMRPLTDEMPKPLLPVGGRPLIEWHLLRLAEAGFSRVVINLGWQGDALRDALGNGERFGVDIRYSEEGFPALETGGGIFRALPLLGGEPFLVVNSDIWTDFPFRDIDCPAWSLAHLVMIPNPPHNPSGDFFLEDGRVRCDGGHRRLTFSGIGVYRPGLFDGCAPGRFALAPLLEKAMRKDRVSGQLFAGEWRDIGDPARLAELRDDLSPPAGAGRSPAPDKGSS